MLVYLFINVFVRTFFHILILPSDMTAAVAQSVSVFAPQATGWVFKSQPRQTLVVKTGSDSKAVARGGATGACAPPFWP